ncbi:MAG: OmpA family protein [Bacteroidales bacterium]|nr:OmpA family protein [Bacteroidales bacterium]
MKNSIFFAALFVAAAVTAQQSRHEFSVGAGGGLSTLNVKPALGKATQGFGGFFGLGYTYRLSEKWEVGTGVSAALFNSRLNASELNESYPSSDGTEDVEYRYRLSGYSENQQAILLNIPVMLRFQTGKLYAALGGKAGIPLSATYDSKAAGLTASGYYAASDLTLNDPPFMGFGEFANLSGKGDLELKSVFFASAELGLKWQLGGKTVLYTGVYVDYGLNSALKPPAANAHLIDYRASDDYQPNSALTSSNAGRAMVDKLNPVAAGIKLSLAFGSSKSGASAASAAGATVSQPAADVQLEEERRLQAAEEQRKAEEQQFKIAEEQRKADEQRLKVAEEQRKADEQRLAEETRKAEETRLYAEAVTQIQQPVSGYSVGSAELSPENKSDLDEKAALLQRHPNMNVLIEGHTCNIGTHAVNITIGQNRANVAKDYLVRKGIAATRITTVSKAETEPVVPNTNEENRRKNRRVEIKIEN